MTGDQLDLLSLPFTEREIKLIIWSLPSGKSPGPDGFSGEYYKLFAERLTPHLLKVYQQATTTSRFPEEMLKALVVTLPKPGKNPDVPSNFRPISLLNIDLKIYAKILAKRLAEYMPLLIHRDQAGFTKGREAPDATRRVISLLSGVEHSGAPSLLLALDAEKAFDRVHWGFMQSTLQAFGITGNFLRAINSLYSCPTAQVYTMGCLSTSFSISNGTRQGCPLSPLIFNLVIETLASKIREDSGVKGTQCAADGPEYKLTLFADDVLLFLSQPGASLKRAMQIVSHFSDASYYKLNFNKCVAMGLNISNQFKQRLKSTYPFEWPDKGIPYLGTIITPSTSSLFLHNYSTIIESLPVELRNLQKEFMSWSARIAAFKMMVLPKLLYIFRTVVIPLPSWYFPRLNSLLSKYI